MHFSLLDNISWAAGTVSTFALLVVLLVRGRWRQFPLFTVWFAFLLARTLVLFLCYQHGSRLWYTRIYYAGLWPDFALQLGIAIEMARIVLRPTGTWVQDAKIRFAAIGLLGTAVAALVSWEVSPPTASAATAWMLRGNLFTTLVICELFVGMTMTANRLGLGWRNHVMAIGQGLTVWLGVMAVTDALHTYLSTRYFADLNHVRGIAYCVGIWWIIIQLWIPEPERQPIAPELREHILALHQRVAYDLRRLDARH